MGHMLFRYRWPYPQPVPVYWKGNCRVSFTGAQITNVVPTTGTNGNWLIRLIHVIPPHPKSSFVIGCSAFWLARLHQLTFLVFNCYFLPDYWDHAIKVTLCFNCSVVEQCHAHGCFHSFSFLFSFLNKSSAKFAFYRNNSKTDVFFFSFNLQKACWQNGKQLTFVFLAYYYY